jgi:MOSC domain-containing protein
MTSPANPKLRVLVTIPSGGAASDPVVPRRTIVPNDGGSSMLEIGQVEAIFRYPVKSMGGERLEVANLGWHGLEGDRRLAFRKIDDRGGFPWLSASKLPDLLRFAPSRREDDAPGDIPTHIRTPEGEEMPVFGEALATEVGRRNGAPVQMMQLKHGIFDEATISVIASDTVREIGRLAGQGLDVRRFRPNVLVRLLRPAPFQEDEWVGGSLSFGEGADAPTISVTMRDIRCSMVNFDPDSAQPAPEVLKAVVRVHQNTAGIYGAVTRTGRLAVGQAVLLRADKSSG